MLVKKVETDQRVVECLEHFHATRSQAFACAKMASALKKLRQTLLSTFFFKKDKTLKHGM